MLFKKKNISTSVTPPLSSSEQMPVSQHPPEDTTTHSTLQELIEKNIKWSQVIYEQNRRLNRRLTLMVVSSYIRLFLIVAPIVLALIFLPPYVRDVVNTYGNLLTGDTSQSKTALDQIHNFIQRYENSTTSSGTLPTAEQVQKYLRSQHQ